MSTFPSPKHAGKVWQRVDSLIEDFHNAKARCGAGNNPAAKATLKMVRDHIRQMTKSGCRVVRSCALFVRCLLLR